VCEQPATKDFFTATINAATCTANAPVMTTTGTCTPRIFHWKIISSNGSPGGAYPPDAVYDGNTCACGSANSGVCYIRADASRQPYNCSCQ